ncbi:MAG: thioredoxin family protein [Chitinophagales bacterium]|nr:thioredoxin family protein [Chitinophagales bacterium]
MSTKKQLFSLLLLTVTTVFSQAQNRSISFEKGAWSEIKAKAQKVGKPIFVDAYTVWCGPCKLMAENVFTTDTVADYYNANYINVSIDMEKGEGKALVKQWAVTAFPMLLYFSPKGELLHRACGSRSTAEFIQLGKDAVNPETQLVAIKQKYENGNRDADFIAAYISLLRESCTNYFKEIKDYFSTQKDEDLTNKRNWDLLKLSFPDMDSREFKYLEANQAAYEKLYDPKEVSNTITDVYVAVLHKAANDSSIGYAKSKEQLLKRQNPLAVKAIALSDISYYREKKDYKNFATAASYFMNTYQSDDPELLNNIAWTFFEEITNKVQLTEATAWAKKAVDISGNFAMIDTYANLLYKTGNKAQAIEQEKRAIEQAKAVGFPAVDEFEKTLKKFEGK